MGMKGIRSVFLFFLLFFRVEGFSSRIQSLRVREVDLTVRATFPLVEAVDVKSFLAIEAFETLFVILLAFEVDVIFLEAAFAFFAAFRGTGLA